MALSDDTTELSADDRLWFKDAIIYEIQIRAFSDSNGDGVGDFAGLIDKLDYVQDLGVTAIWLLPFYPSPQRDGGYDIADYRKINPTLGTIAEFKRLMREAHRRGIRVITELVINHTSDQHPWFQRARRSPPGSRYRDWYVWSDSPDRYSDARIIFQDYETSNWTWDPLANAYYWHRFYSHQPDLNFDNPEVRATVFETLDYWMALGVDGLRLDAIPYLFERDGTNCENLPETHAFLKELRAHIDAKYPGRMLLAEANQWPEDAAAYFGDGDECHMNFHFPLMPRMFMALQLENSFPIVDILQQTPTIPETCQWAIFLRNHDELTLEMVTDEDRDFMYKVYAHDPQMRVNLGIRRRLAPLLRTRARIELMNALLFSMPGTPVMYYGDEIGMGDNVWLGDRDGVRTPMQWSPDRNAGFSSTNPQRLFLPVIIDPEHHYETVNVEAQQSNGESLLWWTKRLIALRKRHLAFSRGDIELLAPDNGKVLAYFRTHGEDRILVVANLSRAAQYVELDLHAHAGSVPVELFGHGRFPAVGEKPYLLTLGPHAFYWFKLEKPRTDEATVATITTKGRASALIAGSRGRIELALAQWLPRQRWFRGKARVIDRATIRDAFELGDAHVLLVETTYADAQSETYVVPVAFVNLEHCESIVAKTPRALVARVKSADGDGAMIDALATEQVPFDLLGLVLERGTLRGMHGVLRTRATSSLPKLVDRSLATRKARTQRRQTFPPRIGSAEQSNTNVLFGDKLVLKVLRAIEPGEHPEEEMGRFLGEHVGFGRVPRMLGSLAYDPDDGGHTQALGVLQELVPNQGDVWEFTLDALQRFFEEVWSGGDTTFPPQPTVPILQLARQPVAEIAKTKVGPYLALARLLGARTAELHLALGSETEDPAFVPEAFTLLHQRSIYQSARSLLMTTFDTMRRQLDRLPPAAATLASELLPRRKAIEQRLAAITREKIDAVRTRVHGDLHLGQILYSAGDFVFLDFEGEPARTLSERRRKRSPLRDVAALLRSFHYAAAAALGGESVREQDIPVLEPWARAWPTWVGAQWLGAWLDTVGNAPFMPRDPDVLARMLDFYLLEKCIYEVHYELANRPSWLAIPLGDLVRLLDTGAT
jgi:maltose alpha-D-glucosyltransferase/alpha-amylase